MHGLKHKQQRKTGRAKKRTRSNTDKVVKKWRCSKHRQTNVLKVQNKIIQSDKETDRLVYISTRSKRHFQRMGLTGDGQHEVTLKKTEDAKDSSSRISDYLLELRHGHSQHNYQLVHSQNILTECNGTGLMQTLRE